jgi:hypothetical protein
MVQCRPRSEHGAAQEDVFGRDAWPQMCCCDLQERGFCARGDSIVALHRIGNASVIKVCPAKFVCLSVRSMLRCLLKWPEITHGSMICRLWT